MNKAGEGTNRSHRDFGESFDDFGERSDGTGEAGEGPDDFDLGMDVHVEVCLVDDPGWGERRKGKEKGEVSEMWRGIGSSRRRD